MFKEEDKTMKNKTQKKWDRDEYQISKTGKIDTRGLYIAIGLLLILTVISSLGIVWASTGTQMIAVLFILIIHQVIEQTLGGTDPYFLKISKVGQIILAVLLFIFSISYIYDFLNGKSFLEGQITFQGMFTLMMGITLFVYSTLIAYLFFREKVRNNGNG